MKTLSAAFWNVEGVLNSLSYVVLNRYFSFIMNPASTLEFKHSAVNLAKGLEYNPSEIRLGTWPAYPGIC